jgi:hypothetical protein
MSSISSDSPTSTQYHGFYGWTDTLKGVYYGPGSLGTALPKLLDKLGGSKALIVTGKSLYHKVALFPLAFEPVLMECHYRRT